MADMLREQGFNPPPAVRPGENPAAPTRAGPYRRFQSAPGGEAGGEHKPAERPTEQVSIRPRR